MDRKILIALQYWDGDRTNALALARYLADLEPEHSKDADFLFMARFDSSLDEATIKHVARKFNVFSVKSRRRGVGWPCGCNELWFSVMEWVQSMVGHKKTPHYKAIFTCEADGAPIPRDWVKRMSAEWDRVNTPRPIVMAGAMQANGPHINGNALMSGDLNFLTWIGRRVGGVVVDCGWDYCMATDFHRRGWADIPGMKSLYNTPTFSAQQYEDMVKQDWIWVHGGKDQSLINFGRARHKV